MNDAHPAPCPLPSHRSSGHYLEVIPIKAKRLPRGFTLVEVMISMTLLTLLALGAVASMLQTRRMAEDNVAQATAAAIAQGIIEQVQLVGFANLGITDITHESYSSTLSVKFMGVTSRNLTSVQTFLLPWASDDTTFTEIGERADPSDPASPILGVLLDVDYKVGAKVVRPKRYLRMAVNLRRIPHLGDNNVEVVLTYRWHPPSRRGTSITREMRTVRSETRSY